MLNLRHEKIVLFRPSIVRSNNLNVLNRFSVFVRVLQLRIEFWNIESKKTESKAI